MYLAHLLALETLFLLFGCIVQLWYKVIFLQLLHFLSSLYLFLSLGDLLFSKGKQRGNGSGEEEWWVYLGVVDGVGSL